MLQLKIEGHYIDLYDLDPPKLNFTIEDIRDTAARSMFSRTFRIPATSNNTDYFETAFDINGVDFDVRQKRSAELLVNGILFRTGQVRLNKVFDTREGARLDYEIIFLGETKDFGTSVGEGYLNELKLESYDHSSTLANVEDSWQAYPQGSITDGLFNGDILYPLIDFGVNYDEDGNAIETLIQQDNTAGVKVFTKSGTGNPLPVRRFKPMVRAKVLVDAIFDEAGYTYSSNFFDSNRFKQIYISAFGNTADINTEGSSNIMSVGLNNDQTGITTIPFDLEYYDYGNNFNTSTHRYNVPVTGTYQINYTLYLFGLSGEFASGTLESRVVKNGTTTLASDSETWTGNQAITLSNNFTTTLNAGDYLEMTLVESGSVDIYSLQNTSGWQITSAPGIVSIPPLLDDKYNV